MTDYSNEGRIRIYSGVERITIENVQSVIDRAIPTHRQNSAAIRRLWLYYKGRQPILERVKESRPEICNNVVENHAQEAVNFKVGYQFSEPMQYVPRSDEDSDPSNHSENEDKLVNDVRMLNTFCFADDKASSDRDLFEWMCICGVGYRMVQAVDMGEDMGSPFRMHVLDPRNAFVIRSSRYHHEPLAAVWYGIDEESGEEYYTVYTDDLCYKKSGKMGKWSVEPNANGICIFEYELNNARMGVFEPAIPILNAINSIASNRVDAVEQTVQSLLVFDNVNIDGEKFDEMRLRGAIKTVSREGCNGKVYAVSNDLDQSQTQVTKKDLYDAFSSIVGMPNVGASSGGADTGTAVMLRDGWTLAESHAKSYELKWKSAERQMLKLILKICRTQSDEKVDLKLRDVEMAFNRRNYTNTLVKAQTLTTMLSATDSNGLPLIDPELAYEQCGLFTDPTSAYLQSKAHMEAEREKRAQEGSQCLTGASNEHDDAVQQVAQANAIAQETGFHPAG